VDLVCEDLREAPMGDRFDLILCRNLAFTYFDEGLQDQLLARFTASLQPGGALVIGARESLPAGQGGLHMWLPSVFRR
jgi:chemotaxis protein methyltransferase CheR